MKIRVNVSTEYGGESYLVETDDIQNAEIKEALEFAVKNPDAKTKKYQHLYIYKGGIIQNGYQLNDALQKANIEGDIPNISVETNI